MTARATLTDSDAQRVAHILRDAIVYAYEDAERMAKAPKSDVYDEEDIEYARNYANDLAEFVDKVTGAVSYDEEPIVEPPSFSGRLFSHMCRQDWNSSDLHGLVISYFEAEPAEAQERFFKFLDIESDL